MNEPRTLTEAREQLEAANAKIIGLEKQVAAYDDQELLTQMGIVKIVNEDNGEVHFESQLWKDQLKQQADLTAQHAEAIEAVRLLKIDLNTSIETAATEKAAYEARITQLEAGAKTVEARAREMLASQGGPPLAVDSQEGAELTTDILRTQLQATKDPNTQFSLYQRIKAQEAKAKSKVNGTR